MTDTEAPREPAPEREGRPDDPYAAAAARLGLHTPLGIPEAYPEGVGDHELALLDQVPDIDLDRSAPKKWPEDY